MRTRRSHSDPDPCLTTRVLRLCTFVPGRSTLCTWWKYLVPDPIGAMLHTILVHTTSSWRQWQYLRTDCLLLSSQNPSHRDLYHNNTVDLLYIYTVCIYISLTLYLDINIYISVYTTVYLSLTSPQIHRTTPLPSFPFRPVVSCFAATEVPDPSLTTMGRINRSHRVTQPWVGKSLTLHSPFPYSEVVNMVNMVNNGNSKQLNNA